MKKIYLSIGLIALILIGGCSQKEENKIVETPTAKQPTTNVVTLSTCGNGVLDNGETLNNCKGDYIPRCNNGICEPQFREHYGDCSEDCPDFCVVDDLDKYSGEDECEYTKNRAKYEAEINDLLKR